MNIKNKVICFGLMVILSVTFAGCGFNENKAKADSEQQIESFLKLYNNKQVIVNSTDKTKVKNFVNNKFKDYFTKDFINDTDNSIDSSQNTVLYQDNNTFYLEASNDEKNTQFYGNYKISSPTVNKDKQTVTYEIKTDDNASTKTYLTVTMKQENGKWKINRAN